MLIESNGSKAFKACLEKRDFEAFEKHDFFGGYSSVKSGTVRRLLEKLLIQFDENDLDIQEKFYLLLDKIIDGICSFNYARELSDNNYYKFKSVNQINDCLLGKFTLFAKLDNPLEEIELFVRKFIKAFGQNKSFFSECYQNVLVLFNEYRKSHTIDYNSSIGFYNSLLNKQRNDFVKKEKELLISNLTLILPYAERKEKSRIVGAKIKKFDNFIKRKKFIELGVSEDELRREFVGFCGYLNSLKELRQENLVLTQEQCDLMVEEFFESTLSAERVFSICDGVTVELARFIYDKFTQIKIKYLDKISVTKNELSGLDLGYNYNNYKIVSKDRYYDNLYQMFLHLTEEDAECLLREKNNFIFSLLFFVDYDRSLSVENVIAILKNYLRIVRDFGETPNTYFGLPFDKLLTYGLAYENANDFVMQALGIDVVKKIIFGGGMTSKNSDDYLQVYLKMLKRDKTSVPPVTGEFDKYYYESARDADSSRLLIGKICDASCVGPDADVILFKERETDEVVARSICFRRGNFVILAPIYGKNSDTTEFYNPKLISAIAMSMLNKATEALDSLAYIFISDPVEILEGYYDDYDDNCLYEDYPHADLFARKYLLGSRTVNVELNPNEGCYQYYDTVREKVRSKKNISSSDLNRLMVLSILFPQDKYYIKEKLLSYKALDIDDYDDVYLGQDWAIMIKDGKVVNSIVLPVSCDRQFEEICKVSNYLNSVLITHDVYEDIYNGKVGSR